MNFLATLLLRFPLRGTPSGSLAHAHGAANKFLESYFHAHNFAKNSFQMMQHQMVNVQVESR
jgi:hypothetical protein